MNVLVLHSELGVLRGGGENFTRNLFTAFAERGHRVAAAFVADRNGSYPIPLPPAIKAIPIRGWWSRNLGERLLSVVGRYIPFKSGLKTTWDRFQEAVSWRAIEWHNRRFRRKVKRQLAWSWKEYDSVYVHGDPILASEVSQYLPTILRLPGPISTDFSPFLKNVHAVCANGDALSRTARFLGESLIELPAGVDQRLFNPGPTVVRSTLRWSDQQWVIGYVGRLTQIKGVDLLAAAFLELSHQLSNMRLLIIGQGQAEATLRSLLAKQLQDGRAYIELDVDHEQLPQWYRAMDLFVMPSRYENHSNAVLEAMACGIPFLASDIGGNRPLADTGSGWLFAAGSVSSLVLSLSNIFSNRGDLKARGEIGSRYIRERYNWQLSAKRLEEVIISCLGVRG